MGAYPVLILPSQAQSGGSAAADSVIKSRIQERLGKRSRRVFLPINHVDMQLLWLYSFGHITIL
jgi:hypothetical protein